MRLGWEKKGEVGKEGKARGGKRRERRGKAGKEKGEKGKKGEVRRGKRRERRRDG